MINPTIKRKSPILLPGLLLPSLVLTSATLFCNNSWAFPYTDRPFQGFYTGIGVGESNVTGRVTTTRNSTISASTFNFSSHTDSHQNLRRNSFAGTLFAGYGCHWDPFYVSVEGFAKGAKARSKLFENNRLQTNFLSSTSVLQIQTQTIAHLRTGEYGGDLRPGVLLSPESMLYGRIGAAFNKLSIQSVRQVITQNPNLNFPLSHRNTKNVTGWRLGAGLEQLVCECWSVRADYTYTNYRHLQKTHFGSVTFPTFSALQTASLFGKTKAKFNSHTVTLAVSYYW